MFMAQKNKWLKKCVLSWQQIIQRGQGKLKVSFSSQESGGTKGLIVSPCVGYLPNTLTSGVRSITE